MIVNVLRFREVFWSSAFGGEGLGRWVELLQLDTRATHSGGGQTRRQRSSLGGLAFFCFLHRCFGTDESNLGMLAIAEGLIHASAATAQREGGLAGEIELIARSVYEFDRPFRGFHSIRAIRTNRDFHLSHIFSVSGIINKSEGEMSSENRSIFWNRRVHFI